jgi:hypothetical protein
VIWVWIFVVIGLVSASLVYFELTPFIMEFFDQLVLWGAPAWGIGLISKCYHVGFIILAVGIILYGLLHSTKDEPDTYKF